jgi:TspO/MBR family
VVCTPRKPVIQPPGVAFGPVWTALYADIAITSAIAIDRLPEQDRAKYERALAANLALNASWSWVFFRFHRLGLAVAVAAALALSSGDLVRRTAAADRGPPPPWARTRPGVCSPPCCPPRSGGGIAAERGPQRPRRRTLERSRPVRDGHGSAARAPVQRRDDRVTSRCSQRPGS